MLKFWSGLNTGIRKLALATAVKVISLIETNYNLHSQQNEEKPKVFIINS